MKSYKLAIALFLGLSLSVLTACTDVDGNIIAVNGQQETIKNLDGEIEEVVTDDTIELDLDIVNEAELESQYAESMSEVSGYIGTNVTNLFTMIDMANTDPLILVSEEFRAKTEELSLGINDNIEQAKSITPPSRHAESHELFISAVEEHGIGVDLFHKGVTENDYSLIERSFEHFDNGFKTMKQVTEKFIAERK